MPLLIIPFGMFLYVCINPDWQWEHPGLEYLFVIVGVPILIANFAAWFHPEIIKAYFPMNDDGVQRQDKRIALAIVMSTLIAFTFAGVGVVSAIPQVSLQPTLMPPAALPATATAFALSVERVSDPSHSSVKIVIPTPTPEIVPDQTALIPVSGGEPTNSPALVVTQTEIASPSIEPTNTVDLFARCSPASQEYLDAIWQAVEDANPDSEVETGWAVQSRDAANLWFVAAKIHGLETDVEATPTGVWALFIYPEGNFDIYSINDIAMEFSYTAWGEDSDPVITMQNDGAQIAYDCTKRAE